MEVSPEEAAAANEETKKKFQTSAVKLGLGAVVHPIQYVKVLIQLGHEPMPLKQGRTWGLFGRKSQYLPNGFSYIKFIYQRSGFTGLYNGVGANICANAASAVTSMGVAMYMDKHYPDYLEPKEDEKLDESTRQLRTFVARALRETFCKAAGSIVGRPFQVVMIRKMAQFVGDETSYTSMPSSFILIYREEGLQGLFKGLSAQLMCDIGTVWAMHAAMYGLDRLWTNYISPNEIEDGELDGEETETERQKGMLKKVLKFALPFIVNTVFYPYTLVATVMAVNGTRLAAGRLPVIPIFSNWQDCWDYLDSGGHLKRGSKMFFRNYTGPIAYNSNHQPVANMKALGSF